MTQELQTRFIEDTTNALRNIVKNLSNDDTKRHFINKVTYTQELDEDNTPITRLANALEIGFGWAWYVVEDELSSIVDDIAENIMQELFGESLPSEDAEDEDELECWYDEIDEDELVKKGLEIVPWGESQYLMELPNHRQHSKLINSEEGLEQYGSSAYIVESAWLDDFREDGLYDY